MSCTCVCDNEKRLAEHYSKQLGVPASAEAKNVAIVFGAKVESRPFLFYAIKADKPGYRSVNGKNIHMFFNFCPFCGVKTEEVK